MSRTCLVSSILMAMVLALVIPNGVFSDSTEDKGVVRRNQGIGSITVMVGFLFHHQIPDDAFTGNVVEYQVSEACGESLPSWLGFDQTTKTFTGFTKANLIEERTFICVKAIGNTPPSVAKDVFSIDVDVGLTPDFACAETDSVVLATVYVDLTLPELSKEDILKVLNSVAEALNIAPEKIRFTRFRNKYSPVRNPVLFEGKGDREVRQNKGARIQFQVGCSSDSITEDNRFVQFLKQKAPTGELSRIIGYPVLEWTVHKGFPRGNASSR